MSASRVPRALARRLVPVLVTALVGRSRSGARVLFRRRTRPIRCCRSWRPRAARATGSTTPCSVPGDRAGRRHDGAVHDGELAQRHRWAAPPAGPCCSARTAPSTRGRAWTRQATAADAGTNVTVTTTATIKDTMSVAVYRSDAGTSAVTASAQTAGTTSSTSHTTPVGGRGPGRFLAGQLLEREVLHRPTTWTPPATSTTRATPAATGSGRSAPCSPTPALPWPPAPPPAAPRPPAPSAGGDPAVLGRHQPRHRHHPTGQPAPGALLHHLLHRPDLQLRRHRHHRPRQQPADLRLELRRRHHRHRRHLLAHLRHRRHPHRHPHRQRRHHHRPDHPHRQPHRRPAAPPRPCRTSPRRARPAAGPTTPCGFPPPSRPATASCCS